MNWMWSLSIRIKILLIPSAAILGLAFILGFIFVSNTKNVERLDIIDASNFPVLDLATANVLLLKQLDDTLKSAVIAGEIAVLEEGKALGRTLIGNVDQQMQLDSALSDEISLVRTNIEQYIELSTELAEGFISGDADLAEITELANRKKALYSEVEIKLQNFKDSRLEYFKNALRKTNDSQVSSLSVAMTIGFLTVAVLLAISFSAIFLVNSSIGEVAESLKDIAEGEGDLTKRIEQHGTDELGQLVRWFNVFADKLQHTISEVVQTIPPLLDVSQQMQTVSTESARVNTQQDTAFNDMSSEMHSMLSTVSSVNDNADSAAKAASDADSEAKNGVIIVDETVRSITDVAEQVQRASEELLKLRADTDNVGNILDVIRGIAEQTNLLALNAAIEAARAGEQGRGFAVVADEVRTLASRTQDSTTEIQSLIENLQHAAQSTSEVMISGKKLTDACVEKASTAGGSLTTITDKVTRITEMNQQIAVATKQQESYSTGINRSVDQMQDASQIVSSNISQLSGLSNSLQTLADKLNAVSTQFRV